MKKSWKLYEIVENPTKRRQNDKRRLKWMRKLRRNRRWNEEKKKMREKPNPESKELDYTTYPQSQTQLFMREKPKPDNSISPIKLTMDTMKSQSVRKNSLIFLVPQTTPL